METNFIMPFPKLDLGNGLNHKAEPAQNSTMFDDIFKSAIENVQQASQVEDEGALAVATGNSDALHNLTIASTQAELSLKLFVQLRNKGHEAYSEIMRMGI